MASYFLFEFYRCRKKLTLPVCTPLIYPFLFSWTFLLNSTFGTSRRVRMINFEAAVSFFWVTVYTYLTPAWWVVSSQSPVQFWLTHHSPFMSQWRRKQNFSSKLPVPLVHLLMPIQGKLSLSFISLFLIASRLCVKCRDGTHKDE